METLGVSFHYNDPAGSSKKTRDIEYFLLRKFFEKGKRYQTLFITEFCCENKQDLKKSKD